MWIPSYFFLQLVAPWLFEHSASGPTNGPLEAVYLGLSIAPTPALQPTSVLSAITEANYTGYARQELVWYPTYRDVGGQQNIEGAGLHFQPTDGVTPNQITGLFIADALTAGNLLLSQQLATPVPMSSQINALTAKVLLQLQALPLWGSGIVLA